MKSHMKAMKYMTEENLRGFITCPYKFYYEYIEKKKLPKDWRHMVQQVVNHVVFSYFRLPIEQRSAAKILSLVDRYWINISPQIFESRIQYYTVTAKITDYLMQNLTIETDSTPPLFLFEKFKSNIQELDMDISLTIDVAEWSNSSIVVKKYLVEAEPDMLMLYNHLIAVFSKKVLNKIPDRIEVTTLLDGKKHTFFPTSEKIEESIRYLQAMNHFLGNSSSFNEVYNEDDCGTCPFEHVCKRDARNVNESTTYFS
ncbi:PD-(D/E)XK nuclease family protein [Bacillus sp. sid0103]|uniref:PD-(D/E)XK nuclease family protein n=1 Tax=Bacillus sp. sid0103 TaxID=2856337 RepID=UPI001C4892C3|nr:PD-(D/E)XK nuclease family protein [Bacillus sp. sid0103]MBV7503649.1 PD-(D/E)XK nuclease family protein [Bacillus sp. sid0103]